MGASFGRLSRHSNSSSSAATAWPILAAVLPEDVLGLGRFLLLLACVHVSWRAMETGCQEGAMHVRVEGGEVSRTLLCGPVRARAAACK